jgi:NRAMP (natural resistance-associated macrophage protein)-like metal ion transporter
MASKVRKPRFGREAKHLIREAGHLGREANMALAYEEKQIYKYGRMLGPGLIAGAADDDAGGIATYSIVGATTGYALSWLMLLSTPMLIVVQGICARLGNVTRKGLATLIKEKFGIGMAVFASLILVIANVATISADVAGMSVAMELLSGISWVWFAIPLSVIVLYVIVYHNFNTIQKALIYLSLVLLAYVVAGIFANPDWGALLLSTFIPKIEFSLSFLTAAVGLLGTTITPYLFFWQTATEIEAKRGEKEIKRVDVDIFTGMIYSNLVSYFIIVSTGTLLFHQLGSDSLAKAADPAKYIALALKPVAGDYSYYLFALGLLAASILAIAVLASSTAYVVSETLGWKKGLNKKLNQAKGFYAVLCGSVALGAAILLAGVKPMDAMYYSQVLCGVIDPILLFLIVKLASDKELMGAHAITGWWKGLAWLTVGVISLFVAMLFKTMLGV